MVWHLPSDVGKSEEHKLSYTLNKERLLMKEVTSICIRHVLHEVRKTAVEEPVGSPHILKLVTGHDLQPFASI